MTETEKLNIARQLYKPTKEKEKLVLSIDRMLESNNIGKYYLPNGSININGKEIVSLEREDSHCMVLVYIEDLDHFCSAFMLEYDELKELHEKIVQITKKLTC